LLFGASLHESYGREDGTGAMRASEKLIFPDVDCIRPYFALSEEQV
jgi:hypothetical protein